MELSYLIASGLFIWGLKDLSSPLTARRGNFLAAFGMFLAVAATLLHRDIVGFSGIFAGMVIGTAVGAVLATRIQMTAMPQMVALLNGFGGGASALVGMAEYYRVAPNLSAYMATTIGLSLLIGWVTFTGSVIAFAKLQDLVSGAPLVYRFQNGINGIFLGLAVLLLGSMIVQPASPAFLWLALLSAALGVLFVLPIGGADMPVVISLLNSFSGLAAAATGFVISNNVLIISGALVGSSGIILAHLMCVAMNRSLWNVLFSAFGQVKVAPPAAGPEPQRGAVKTVTVEEAVDLFLRAKSVIIVPGYGMAAAQAQHGIRELADLLKARGTSIKYAIHPVAGRMPGHMNVLLAEANVPYTELVEMDDINPEFSETDVALVMGANDVVNPAARNDPASPIYGMPILDVDKAKTVIVCKRSMNPGFARIDNGLFVMPQTYMLFGDAKSTAEKLVATLKQKQAAFI